MIKIILIHAYLKHFVEVLKNLVLIIYKIQKLILFKMLNIIGKDGVVTWEYGERDVPQEWKTPVT